MISTGMYLTKLLEAYGVDTVFGIPGVHTVELYRGLAGSSTEIHGGPASAAVAAVSDNDAVMMSVRNGIRSSTVVSTAGVMLAGGGAGDLCNVMMPRSSMWFERVAFCEAMWESPVSVYRRAHCQNVTAARQSADCHDVRTDTGPGRATGTRSPI